MPGPVGLQFRRISGSSLGAMPPALESQAFSLFHLTWQRRKTCQRDKAFRDPAGCPISVAPSRIIGRIQGRHAAREIAVTQRSWLKCNGCFRPPRNRPSSLGGNRTCPFRATGISWLIFPRRCHWAKINCPSGTKDTAPASIMRQFLSNPRRRRCHESWV